MDTKPPPTSRIVSGPELHMHPGGPEAGAAPPMAGSAYVMRGYVVRGYALVPHEVEITVEAESPHQAMQKAKRIFERGPQRDRFIVRGSEDLSAAYDFEPNEAKPPLGKHSGIGQTGKEGA